MTLYAGAREEFDVVSLLYVLIFSLFNFKYALYIYIKQLILKKLYQQYKNIKIKNASLNKYKYKLKQKNYNIYNNNKNNNNNNNNINNNNVID